MSALLRYQGAASPSITQYGSGIYFVSTDLYYSDMTWQKRGILACMAVVILAIGLIQSTTAVFPLQHTLPQDEMSGDYNHADVFGEFHGAKTFSPRIPEPRINPAVLGDASVEKRIEVDLTRQRLYALEGDRMVYEFVISSGL